MVLSYFFPYFEPVSCSMWESNCCFLTCAHFSRETVKMVWCSHLFKNSPQFIVIHAKYSCLENHGENTGVGLQSMGSQRVIHNWVVNTSTVKSFRVVNKTEVNVFLEFHCFLYDPTNVGNLISDSSAFSKPLEVLKYCRSLAWRVLSIHYYHGQWVQLSGSLNIL